MGGDEGENVERDAIDKERTSSSTRGSSPARKRHPGRVEKPYRGWSCSEVAVSVVAPRERIRDVRRRNATRFSSSFRAKMSCESERPLPG
jgi:hypothetical protein